MFSHLIPPDLVSLFLQADRATDRCQCAVGCDSCTAFPALLGNLSNLKELWLDDNELSGTLPDELGGLTNLQYLTLKNNLFAGMFPQSLLAIGITYLNFDETLTFPPMIFDSLFENVDLD